jgi:hypothetical protein
VLLAEEEAVHDRLTEIGRCYGMEMNVEKTKVNGISRQPSSVQLQKTTRECGIFQPYG